MKHPKITTAVKTAVDAYLMARVFAECKREQVDKIEREILAECPLSVLDEWRERGQPDYITEPRFAWLSRPDEFAEYVAECHHRERERGVKPADMPADNCPALVAEDMQRKAEYVLITLAGEMIGAPEPENLNNGLLCHPEGLKRRQEFIDLVVGLVVNSPGYRNPLAVASERGTT